MKGLHQWRLFLRRGLMAVLTSAAYGFQEAPFQVVQPSQGLSPRLRYLWVRWKEPPASQKPLSEPLPFQIVPEVPIDSFYWIGPRYALIHLGGDLLAGQTYTISCETHS